MTEKTGADPFALDLFGAPRGQVRERWGRPSFRKTKKNKKFVGLLRSAGWSQERIAAEIGCDAKTLRKIFSRELQAGRDMIEARMLTALLKRVEEGNVSAMRLLSDVLDKGEAKPPMPAVDEAPREVALGKKEQLAVDAVTPPQTWGDRLRKAH